MSYKALRRRRVVLTSESYSRGTNWKGPRRFSENSRGSGAVRIFGGGSHKTKSTLNPASSDHHTAAPGSWNWVGRLHRRPTTLSMFATPPSLDSILPPVCTLSTFAHLNLPRQDSSVTPNLEHHRPVYQAIRNGATTSDSIHLQPWPLIVLTIFRATSRARMASLRQVSLVSINLYKLCLPVRQLPTTTPGQVMGVGVQETGARSSSECMQRCNSCMIV